MDPDSTIDDRQRDEAEWDEKCDQIRARTREIYLSDNQIKRLQGFFHIIILKNSGLKEKEIDELSEEEFKYHPIIQQVVDGVLNMLINNDQLSIRIILQSYGTPNPKWPMLNL